MDKIIELTERIRQFERVAVAFSGGIDSCLLLSICSDALGAENAVGVFVDTAFVADEDRKRLDELSKQYRIVRLTADVFTGEICVNGSHRCELCKQLIFGRIREFAKASGFPQIVDGVNCSDIAERRTTVIVSDSMGISHPLAEAGLFKEDIFTLAKKCGVSDIPQGGRLCYAEKIAPNEFITIEKIEKVRFAERALKELGVSAFVKLTADGLELSGGIAQLPDEKLDQLKDKLGERFDSVIIDLG